MKRYVIKRPAGAQMPDRLARYREELNEEQFAVATAPAGSALVIAGAGSGKTRAITYRVAYLVEHDGVLHPDDGAAQKQQGDTLRQTPDAGGVWLTNRRPFDYFPADKLHAVVFREDSELAHPLVLGDGETASVNLD